ncbi:MAG: SDR family oxidoreductase [Chthoniobacterales bacterium]|nr:SDR family oxidoreductase [Chthoniobacterales bacterium]
MKKIAVVTGAGSGVGRACAIRLANEGYAVAVLSRREPTLHETIALANESARKNMLAIPCDIGDEPAVADMARKVLARFEQVDVLINAAGTNTAERSLAQLSSANYHDMMGANMHGAYYCVQAFLRGMRERKRGDIIVINSLAGRRASELSGVAYSMSKFAAAGLVQSINAEENKNGIRACSIFPGDIHTPLLDKRAIPPSQDARQKMLTPDDVTDCVMLALKLPDRAVVEEIVVRPR